MVSVRRLGKAALISFDLATAKSTGPPTSTLPRAVHRVSQWARGSTVPYLSAISIGLVAGASINYFVRSDVTMRSQPLNVAIPLIFVVIGMAFWWVAPRHRIGTPLMYALLGSAALAWGVRISLVVIHDDAVSYLVWATPILLIMLLTRPPTWLEARTVLVVIAYLLASVLVLALALEMFGVTAPMDTPEWFVEFQRSYYWLPLDGFLGIEGRWTGPFGHNTRAAFAAAMVFVIGIGRWHRSSVALVFIGAFFLLATSVRVSYLATIAAVGILLVFSPWKRLSMIPMWVRWSAVVGGALAAGVGFLLSGAGLTGRDWIWPEFASLIPNSPWIGIGGSGIRSAGEKFALASDAHNILLDEVVRFGVVGSAFIFSFFLITAIVALASARNGFALPAGVFVVYFVTSLTDIQNDWLHLSYQAVLVLISGVAAAAWISQGASLVPESDK